MVLSYVAAAVAALLSGLAYAELVVDMPLAGGAFSCTLAIFSEPFAWYDQALDDLCDHDASHASARIESCWGLTPMVSACPPGPKFHCAAQCLNWRILDKHVAYDAGQQLLLGSSTLQDSSTLQKLW